MIALSPVSIALLCMCGSKENTVSVVVYSSQLYNFDTRKFCNVNLRTQVELRSCNQGLHTPKYTVAQHASHKDISVSRAIRSGYFMHKLTKLYGIKGLVAMCNK